jgi:hypothetical protein
LIIFRWLGAHIADDVKLGEIEQLLRFPSNLLNIEHGLTTFHGATLASFEMTKEGLCYLDEIHLDSGINLGNWCTIMPGTRIPSEIIVGSLTLVKQTTVSDHFNSVLLGIPACEMPFAMPDQPSITNDMAPEALYLFVIGYSSVLVSSSASVFRLLYIHHYHWSLHYLFILFVGVLFIAIQFRLNGESHNFNFRKLSLIFNIFYMY